jgi:hypothetical protein
VQQGVDRRMDVGLGHLRSRAGLGPGPLRDQDVDLPERLAGRGEQPLVSGRIGQVDLDPHGAGQLTGDLPGALAPAAGDDDMGALRRQRPGDRLTQPARTGTDDRGAAGDAEVHQRASCRSGTTRCCCGRSLILSREFWIGSPAMGVHLSQELGDLR